MTKKTKGWKKHFHNNPSLGKVVLIWILTWCVFIILNQLFPLDYAGLLVIMIFLGTLIGYLNVFFAEKIEKNVMTAFLIGYLLILLGLFIYLAYYFIIKYNLRSNKLKTEVKL